MLESTMQQSIGHTLAHCGLLKKPTHSVHSSGSISYNLSPLAMPLFGHTGTQAAQLIQASVMVYDIDSSHEPRATLDRRSKRHRPGEPGYKPISSASVTSTRHGTLARAARSM